MAEGTNQTRGPGGGASGDGFHRRSQDEGVDHPPIRLDLEEVERDNAGIPKFVFADPLPEADRPSPDKKTLEVVLLWRHTVISVGHYDKPRQITVGDSTKADFRIACEGIPERFPLLAASGDDFVVRFAGNMTMEVRDAAGHIHDVNALTLAQRLTPVAGTSTSSSSAVESLDTVDDSGDNQQQYRIDLHDRVAVQAGDVTFVLQYVSPARIIPTSFWKTVDLYFTKILSLSFLAHALLLLALMLTPLNPEGLSEDLFKNPNRFAKLLLRELEEPPKKQKKFELSGSKDGAKHKDDEGKFGKQEAKQKKALASTKGAPKVDPNKREKDRKIALESGIFKALDGDKNSAVSNVLGPGGLGTGINNALGGLRGAAMGDARGAGGMGTRGTGPGGGGSSLGIGGLGSGSGRGTGGLGNVDLGGRGRGRYRVVPGRTITKGCLSQQVALRVFRRAQNQAKYCYDKELPRNPNLAGKVTTVVRVGSTGAVQSVSIAANTMENANVEACLKRVMQRLRFPPCQGGGFAEISYPWIFKPTGN